MKFRILFSLILVLGFSALMGQTYQKLSTLERSSAPLMFPLTKTVSGQNIMVYAVFDTAVNGTIDTSLFVTMFHLDSALNAVEGRMTWLKPQLEDSAAVAINANFSFSIDSLPLLNFQARRPAGSSKSQIILSSQTSIPSQIINSNAAGDSSGWSKIQLDYDATSFFEAVILEMRARGGTAKLNLQDTIATIYGTLFLDKYQSPFDYLGSPVALLGVNGLGEVWPIDPLTIGGNIYTVDGSIPAATQRVVTIPAGSSVKIGNTTQTDTEITTALDANRFQTYNGWDRFTNTYGSGSSGFYFIKSRGTFASPTAAIVGDVLHEWAFIAQNSPTVANYAIILKPVITENTGGNLWGSLDLQGADFNTWLSFRRTGIRAGLAANYTTFAAQRPAGASVWQHNADGTGQYVLTSALGGTSNLTVSGTTPNFTISAGGTTMGLVAGNGMDGSVASNILTLNGLRSGTITNGTGWTLLGTLSAATAGGSGLHLNQTGTTHILGPATGGTFKVDAPNASLLWGNPAGGFDPKIILYGTNSGDQLILAPPTANFTGYTFRLPSNGDAAPAGAVVTNVSGGETTFAMPPVYLSFTHTSFQEVSIAEDGIGAIVIPVNLDGYTIISAAYRTQSAVSGTGNIDVELTKTTEGGTLTTGFLDDEIVNGDRFVNATSNPLTVSTGDLIQCLATIGTATAEGLTITLTLTK